MNDVKYLYVVSEKDCGLKYELLFIYGEMLYI